MITADDRLPSDLSRPFDHPVINIFFLKPAFIADEFLHFPELVLTACDTVDLVSEHPCSDFPAAFAALPVGIHWIQEPHPALETEGPVGKCSNGAYVYHIPRKIIVNCGLDEGADFHGITPVKHSVCPLFGELFCCKHAAVTMDATVHMQFYQGS